MTWIVFDCPSGMSGDMTLGALVDAGVPLEVLQTALATLPVQGWTLRAERVTRNTIGATQVHVDVQTEGEHHRHFADIVGILRGGKLRERARDWAIEVFRVLAEAEAAAHRVPVEEVHFHEVGALDAIVDISGACVGLDWLCTKYGVTSMRVSQLVVGRGRTKTEHGTMPVPPPAVLQLAGAFPIQWSEVAGERLTPTGAALLRVFATPLGTAAVRVTTTGYGAGTKDFSDAPNVLRLLLAEPEGDSAGELPRARPVPEAMLRGHGQAGHGHSHDHEHDGHRHSHSHSHPESQAATHTHAHEHSAEHRHEPKPAHRRDSSPELGGDVARLPALEKNQVAVLRTQIDDMVPELFGSVMQRLFDAGALDVFYTPVFMKKSRPGTQVTVVARPDDVERMAVLLLNETTTLGVRVHSEDRYELQRRVVELETKFGRVRVKITIRPDGKRRVTPEYDTIRAVADQAGIPVDDVYRATMHAAEHAKDL